LKTVRQIAIADHLWQALERMAEEMGSDREALVNQALHVFARLNGFVVPGSVGAPAAAAVSPAGVAPPVLPRAERAAIAEQVLDTAARLEREIHAAPPIATPVTAGPGTLVLARDDGAEVLVAKERFVIGRGRHCDLVVDSAKISREHVAIVREGDAWFVEDLDSSNGTWFRRERITRRRIEDGDEYFVCAERLRCTLR
jgi:hypothetical protein